ncbi:hypothetical protein LBMAG52_43030 [Planctomycetia bacterium]|nr:hypothetical protein LBMAG52_43030 [Planctomycetia bacterium]
MNKYEVKCGAVNYGFQFAESMKEAIRFTRMELMAAGVQIADDGWFAKEIING